MQIKNLYLRLSNCASNEKKTIIINKMHGMYVKNGLPLLHLFPLEALSLCSVK
jgi:hypothetical protein